jgi:hypothetical protein
MRYSNPPSLFVSTLAHHYLVVSPQINVLILELDLPPQIELVANSSVAPAPGA